MAENGTPPVTEKTKAEPPPAPEHVPDSIFKLVLQFIWKRHPVVKYGVITLITVVSIIFWFWDKIPAQYQIKFIETNFSCSKQQSPVAKTPPTKAPEHTPDTPHPESEKNSFLLKEIKAKDLLTKLRNARNYLKAGGSPANKEKALRIYQEVLAQLSPAAKRELDQDLLVKANSDIRNEHIDDALAKYKALFDKVLADY